MRWLSLSAPVSNIGKPGQWGQALGFFILFTWITWSRFFCAISFIFSLTAFLASTIQLFNWTKSLDCLRSISAFSWEQSNLREGFSLWSSALLSVLSVPSDLSDNAHCMTLDWTQLLISIRKNKSTVLKLASRKTYINELKAFLGNSLDHPFFSIQKRQRLHFECLRRRWNFNFLISEALSPQRKQLRGVAVAIIWKYQSSAVLLLSRQKLFKTWNGAVVNWRQFLAELPDHHFYKW